MDDTNKLSEAIAAFVGALTEDYSAGDINAAFEALGYRRTTPPVALPAVVDAEADDEAEELERMQWREMQIEHERDLDHLHEVISQHSNDAMHWFKTCNDTRDCLRHLLEECKDACDCGDGRLSTGRIEEIIARDVGELPSKGADEPENYVDGPRATHPPPASASEPRDFAMLRFPEVYGSSASASVAGASEGLPSLDDAHQRLRNSIAWLRDGKSVPKGIGVADMVVIEAALAKPAGQGDGEAPCDSEIEAHILEMMRSGRFPVLCGMGMLRQELVPFYRAALARHPSAEGDSAPAREA